MATFNLSNKFSRGTVGNVYVGNNFIYCDTKLLTRIITIENVLGIIGDKMTNLYANVDEMYVIKSEAEQAAAANAAVIKELKNTVNMLSTALANIQTNQNNRIALCNDVMPIGGETMDDSQKIDYMMGVLDSINNTINELYSSIVSTSINVSTMNETFRTMTKTINDVNSSINHLSSKLGIEPPVSEEPDVPGNEINVEVVGIYTMNNTLYSKIGDVIKYSVIPTGLQVGDINVYVNGVYSHSMKNVENDKEIMVYSEIIYQESTGHITNIMIESALGNFSNIIQFVVDVSGVIEFTPITLTPVQRTVFCAQHDTIELKGIITGATDGFCNVYVNGNYVGFLQDIINGEEIVIYRETVTETKEIYVYIEFPIGNKSEEIMFNVVVDEYVNPDEENKFFIHSDETTLSARSNDVVSYVASIKGLTTETFDVYVNDSYYKTYYVDTNTDLENFVLYENAVILNKMDYIFIVDANNNKSNTLTYEVTLINVNTIRQKAKVDRILNINSPDLEKQPMMNEHVMCTASITGMTGDWCDVYVNGFFNRRLSLLQDVNDVILYNFIATEDCEIEIQIEDTIGFRSNTLRYCIHIQEEDIIPEPNEEELIVPPTSKCDEYTKLIGGNRSTWTRGNQELISDISKLSINCLTLSVRMLIEDVTSINVNIDEEDLNIVKEALITMKSQGILNKVQMILEPCPCINNGEINEREFNPYNQKSFIINWRNEIVRLLNELKDYNFWGIYVNTNMDILYDNELIWQELYDTIKAGRPKSNIMIKTNWWESDEDGEMMGLNTKCTHPYFRIWDMVTISAYFPLASKAPSASYDDIYGWINNGTAHTNQQIKADIRAFAQALNKPIMFGELGIPALDNAVVEPYNLQCGYIEDEQTQRNWYEAWHNSFIDEEWFMGWQFYHMSDLYNSPYDPTDKSSALFIASLDIKNKYKKTGY